MTMHSESGQSQSGHSEIYAQGYEKWDEDRAFYIPSWLLIGKAVLRNVMQPSGCLGWLIFLAFCITLGIYYFFVVMSSFAHFQYENLKNSEAFSIFATFLDQSGIDLEVIDIVKGFTLVQSMIIIPLLMIFYGAQLISKDKAANALQVYFAKAISRFDYVAGKLFVIGFITSLTTLIPGAMVVVIGLFFNTDLTEFLAQAWYVPILVIVYWVMWTVVFGAITLLFSAMFDKSYMAAVAIIGFMGFCTVFALLLERIIGSNGLVDGLNWFWSFWVLGGALFNLEVESWSIIIWRVIDLSIISAFGYYLIFKKINPVEVIK